MFLTLGKYSVRSSRTSSSCKLVEALAKIIKTPCSKGDQH